MKTKTTIDIDKIKPNPHQPRTVFDQKKLEILAKSIKEIGLKNPIQVRKEKNGTYTLKDGDRRLRALKINKRRKLKIGKEVWIIKATDKDLMIDSIIQNCLREGLAPMDKGRAFMRLLEATLNVKEIDVGCNLINRVKNWKRRGRITPPSSRNYFMPEENVKKVAEYLKMLGMSDNTAIMLLMILKLPKDIKDKVVSSTDRVQFQPKDYIGLRQAYQIARIKDVKFQRYLFKEIRIRGWGIVYLRKIVDDFIDSKLTGKEYLDYWVKKRKGKADYSCAEMTRNCFKFASTLRSWRLHNLVALSLDLSRKEFLMGLTDLRNATVDLKKAINERILDTAQLIKEVKKEKRDVKAKAFVVKVGKQQKKSMCRLTIPVKITKLFKIENGDKLHLKIVAVEKDKPKYRGKVV